MTWVTTLAVEFILRADGGGNSTTRAETMPWPTRAVSRLP